MRFASTCINSLGSRTFISLCLACSAFVFRRASSCELKAISGIPPDMYIREEDVMIGVVLPVHRYKSTVLCSDETNDFGIFKRMESIVFAIDEINNNKTLLPEVKLGFAMIDDCDNELVTIVKSFHFIQNTSDCPSVNDSAFQPIEVVAVIGSEGSQSTIKLADIMEIAEVPLISYMSSSSVLSSIDYTYFFRTIPSVKQMSNFIMDLLNTFKWTYVSVLYSEGIFGNDAYKTLGLSMSEGVACFSVVREIRSDFSAAQFDNVAIELSNASSKVVILFLSPDEILGVLQAVKRLAFNKFVWLVGEGMPHNLYVFEDVKEMLHGTLAIRSQTGTVHRFEEYLQKLSASKKSKNPWFEKFSDELNTYVTYVTKDIKGAVTADDKSGDWSFEALSIDAVYAIAHALNKTLSQCKSGLTTKMCLEGNKLRDSFTTVKFRGEYAELSFDDSGDGETNYELVNLYLTADKRLEFKVVARRLINSSNSTSNYSFFNKDKIIWNPVAMNNSDIPISECGDRCVVGHAKVVTTPHCCWKCKVCNEKEKVAVHYPASSCKACPDKTWPDKRTRTHCVPIPPSHIELGSLNGNLLFALSLLVVVFSCVISVVYVIKRNSSFIGAIGLYNSLAMVAGHVVCSLLGLLFVQKPAFNSCVLTLAVFHLSFTFTYGGMLAMCLRLYDLHLQESGASKTKCDNSGVQLMIFAIIVALQVLWLIVGVSIDWNADKIITVMPNSYKKYVELSCVAPPMSFWAPLSLNILLLFVCGGYAAKVRNVSTSFDAAKFIAIGLGTNLLLWIMFFPAYHTTLGYSLKRMILAAFMAINMLLCQGLVLYSRLYAVYFVKEAPIKSPTPFFRSEAPAASSNVPHTEMLFSKSEPTLLPHEEVDADQNECRAKTTADLHALIPRRPTIGENFESPSYSPPQSPLTARPSTAFDVASDTVPSPPQSPLKARPSPAIDVASDTSLQNESSQPLENENVATTDKEDASKQKEETEVK